MIEKNIIYNSDCLVGMRNIPDKSIDLILTDPPYGKKSDKGTNGFGVAKNRRYKGGWDSKIPSKEVFDEMFRVAKTLLFLGLIILRIFCRRQIVGYFGIRKVT